VFQKSRHAVHKISVSRRISLLLATDPEAPAPYAQDRRPRLPDDRGSLTVSSNAVLAVGVGCSFYIVNHYLPKLEGGLW